MTPEQRRTNASIAANTRAAMYDGREVTQRARDKAFARFEREVDPTNSLDPQERDRRARALRRAHMQRIAKKSHEARRRNKAAR
jgi:hypothetical protein